MVTDTFARQSRDPNKSNVRFPIRVKITFPYLLLALFLAVGGVYLVNRIVFDNADERFSNQLVAAGKVSSEWMVREEDRLLESLRLLAHTQGVAEAIEAGDSSRLRELAFPVALNNAEEIVQFLGIDGSPILTLRHRTGGSLEDYLFVQKGDRPEPQWPFVSKVLQDQADNLGDKYSGLVQDPQGGAFYIAGPILRSDGSRVGVVLVGKTLPTIAHQMYEATLAHVTLYDSQGKPLASTLLDGQPLQTTDAAQLMAVGENSSLKRDLKIADISYGEILGPWRARGNESLGLVGSALAKTVVVSTTRLTRIQIGVLVGAGLVLAVLLGINLANHLTQPLFALVKASSEVSQGNLGVQVTPTSNDEIAILAEKFNQMITSLKQSQNNMLQAYDSTLQSLTKALELRDKETEDHCRRVTDMTIRLASLMGIRGEALVHIWRGANLHDIGKVGVPDAILLKPGPLTDAEWVEMRKHPDYALSLLWPVEYLRPAMEIPAFHHEKWDGSGYPKGLKGEEIPLAARIFAVIDVWDALLDNRPYRSAMPVEQAVEIIRKGSGTHFDPQVVGCFLDHLADFQPSSLASSPARLYEHPITPSL